VIRDAARRPLAVALLLAVLVTLGIVGRTSAPAPTPAERYGAAAAGTPARADHGRRAVVDTGPKRASSAAATSWHVDLAPAPGAAVSGHLRSGTTAPASPAPAAVDAISSVDSRAPPGVAA